MTSTARPSSKNWIALAVIGILATFIAITTLPDYLSGGWPWSNPPESPHLKALQAVRKEGMTLPDWQAVLSETADFGGDQWSVQQFSSAAGAVGEPRPPALDEQMLLLLRPQATDSEQPEVEWIDLMGAQRWTVDSQQRLRVDVESAPVRVDFARAWNDQQTFAIAQWYAWPQGGHPSPSHWFWGDQLSQWKHRERLSWIAVSLLLPVPPLSDIAPQQPRIEAAVKTVQAALQAQFFNPLDTAS